MNSMKANDLSCFSFRFAGYGHYRVTYTTPIRGDYWIATINDMSLIDATKNAESVKAVDIRHLRDAVKYKGVHYSSNGKQIDK